MIPENFIVYSKLMIPKSFMPVLFRKRNTRNFRIIFVNFFQSLTYLRPFYQCVQRINIIFYEIVKVHYHEMHFVFLSITNLPNPQKIHCHSVLNSRRNIYMYLLFFLISSNNYIFQSSLSIFLVIFLVFPVLLLTKNQLDVAQCFFLQFFVRQVRWSIKPIDFMSN